MLEQIKLHKINPYAESTKHLAKVLAKVFLQFDVKQKQFYELLQRQLVLEGKKQYPDYSNAQLSGRLGIDRRNITEFSQTSDDFKPKAKEKDIQVMNRLMTYFYKTKSNLIPKKNPFHSFETICMEVANGSLTPVAIATELKRRNLIKDKGDYYEINIDRDFESHKEIEDGFRCFNEGTERLIDTINHNLNVCGKDKDDKDCQFSQKLIQRSVSTVRIQEKYHKEVLEKIGEEQAESFARVEEILSLYEDKQANNKTRIGAQYLSFK
ncbi:hypothetical protein [Marinicella sp. W31]|uniref:hypothetical protein n=1 Tax=Marinicella sp. W31 TaxID=3023713 RepID=UPI0037581157